MGYQSEYLEPPVIESEQGTDAHVVYAALEGAVHGVESPQVIALLGIPWMVSGICLFVISLLEYLESTDTGRLYCLVSLDIQGGRIDVYPAYLSLAGWHRSFSRYGR